MILGRFSLILTVRTMHKKVAHILQYPPKIKATRSKFEWIAFFSSFYCPRGNLSKLEKLEKLVVARKSKVES